MADISRGAAHIKADQLLEIRFFCGADHSDDPTRRTRQQCVFALECIGVGEPSIGLHEHQARVVFVVAKLFVYLHDIATKDG